MLHREKILEMSAFIISSKKSLNFLLSSGIGGFPLKMYRYYRSGKAGSKSSALFRLSSQPIFLNHEAKRKCVIVYLSSLLSGKTDKSLSQLHDNTRRVEARRCPCFHILILAVRAISSSPREAQAFAKRVIHKTFIRL